MSTSATLEQINHPFRETLTEADTAQLGAALLALTREVWALTDRIMVTEAVLARHGLDLSAEIDAFQPDAAMQARLDEAGKRLAASVLDALAEIRPATS